jgi:hypothetical protein
LEQPPPTHRIKHYNFGDVEIYIDPKTLKGLESKDFKIYRAARRAVCFSVRIACSKKDPAWAAQNKYVSWGHLGRLRPI